MDSRSFNYCSPGANKANVNFTMQLLERSWGKVDATKTGFFKTSTGSFYGKIDMQNDSS